MNDLDKFERYSDFVEFYAHKLAELRDTKRRLRAHGIRYPVSDRVLREVALKHALDSLCAA